MSERFWLGERSGEFGVDDYDGRPHRCRVTGWGEEGESRFAIVELEPPIRYFESVLIASAEVHTSRPSDDITGPGPTPVTVIGLDENGGRTVRLKGGWVAATPDDLPLSPDERFRRTVDAVRDWLVAGQPSNPRLERWSHVIRDAYRRGTLPAWQSVLLSGVDGWEWGMPPWEDIFGGFVRREGHGDVPVDWVEDGYRLGMWVAVTRDQRDSLPSSLVAWFESLPGWSWTPSGLGG